MAKLILILAVFAAVIVVVVRLQSGMYQRFMENAGEVTGKIEKKQTRIEAGHSQRNATENVLIYSYVVDGKHYSGEEKVEYDDLWLDAREGMELRVYYSKSNPAKSHPAALIDRRLKIAEKL